MEVFLCRSCQTHLSVAGQVQDEYLSEELQNWGGRTTHRTGGSRIGPVVKTKRLTLCTLESSPVF